MSLTLREARLDDRPALEALIARSIRALGAGDYTGPQIEAALRGAFGVDTQLIRDRSYFVVEDAEGRMVGCGGWSRRRTLFGSDAREGRDAAELDPAVDAAKIRAFFVDPGAARRGIGSRLLSHCEAQARAHGFRRFELMGTLPGVRLYAARGYRAQAPIEHRLGPDLTITFVPMEKRADDAAGDPAALRTLVDRYCEAWSDPDAARRSALLRAVWAPDGTYTDPTADRLDADGLLAHIARVQATRPGARVRRSTAIDTHHGALRFGFVVIGADGAVLRRGTDFARLDATGSRLREVIGFFGALTDRDVDTDA
jgi:GNAT superfamily N-acetyltransferase